MLRQGCEADNGELWGVSMCAPFMILHYQTRAVLTSEAGEGGLLQPAADGVWTGVLPADVNVPAPSELPLLEWADVRWSVTDVMYANPDHQSVHMLSLGWRNAQASLGIPPQSVRNRQMESESGRYYLRLEMRALTRAMRSEGDAQLGALIDALDFRAARHALFPNAVANEIIADRNDGLATYTGVRLGLGDRAREYAAQSMEAQDGANGFEYFYAKMTGPAYGLLLDEHRPNWRRELGALSPADLLARTFPHPAPSASALAQRGDVYGADAVGAQERRWAEAEQTIADLVHRDYTTYARIELPLSPSAEIEYGVDDARPIPGFGIQADVVVRDAWGEVRGLGVVTEDRTKLIVIHPEAGGLSGRGWELTLASGYRIVEPDYMEIGTVERSP